MVERYCRFCRAPIVWAYEPGGALVLCDRQQTLEGDLDLREEAGRLCAKRTWKGGGLYREHVCLKAKEPRKPLSASEEHRRDVEAALVASSKASAKKPGKRGTIGFYLAVLAKEVQILRGGARPEDDAIDALIASYLPLIDELPAPLVEKLEAVRACRKSYYM